MFRGLDYRILRITSLCQIYFFGLQIDKDIEIAWIMNIILFTCSSYQETVDRLLVHNIIKYHE